MRTRLLAFTAALVAALVGTIPAAAAPGEFQAPRHYYLALGDSLAFGFQQNGDFTHGYVDDLSSRLAEIRHIVTVNDGCSGETTVSYFVGCATALRPHHDYGGSQAAAALQFLRKHRNQVSPITLDLGGNDAVGTLVGCLAPTAPPTCIADALPGLHALIFGQMDTILAGLRRAAPRGEIIVLTYYNPFAAAGIPQLTAATNAVVSELNGAITEAAQAHGARVADAYAPFNLVGPLCGSATAPVLAWACFATNPLAIDIHPTTAGYQLIADQMWAASSYGSDDED